MDSEPDVSPRLLLEQEMERIISSLQLEGNTFQQEPTREIPTLKQRIEDIDNDIESRWPEFRDNDHLDCLFDIIAYPNDELYDGDLYDEEFQDYFSEYGSDDHLDKKVCFDLPIILYIAPDNNQIFTCSSLLSRPTPNA